MYAINLAFSTTRADSCAGLEFSRIERAILCRNLTLTSTLIPKAHTGLRSLLDTGPYLGPLELAIGWPEGLSRLVAANIIRVQAVLISIEWNDLDSLEVLLHDHDLDIHDGVTWRRVLSCLQAYGRDSRIIEVVVRSLRNCRQKLRDLAVASLPEDCFAALDLAENGVLDETAPAVYYALEARDAQLPSTLNPAMGSAYSVYHVVLTLSNRSLPLADCLFENGFHSVDSSGTVKKDSLYIETPFYEVFFRQCLDTTHCIELDWLVSKGVSMNFRYSHNFPDFLHCLALKARIQTVLDHRELTSEIEYLVKLSLPDCHILSPDSCVCLCSRDGCLALNKLWKCNFLTHRYELANCGSISHSTLSGNLKDWLQVCEVDSSGVGICYESICRLGLFDRLGMKHTCCSRRMEWPGESMWQEMKGTGTTSMENLVEHQELTQENINFQEQLDLLMHAYISYRQQHRGSLLEFWDV